MPNPSSVGGVVGTDNVSPLYNPSGLMSTWSMNSIYLGQAATGKHVPLVGDIVVQITGAQIVRYIVQDINPATMVPVLVQEEINSLSGTFSDQDILVGIGPGEAHDTYRLYVDKSVTPYRILVDERCRIGTVSTVGVRLFRGSDLSTAGQIISQVFDGSGNFISDMLGLQLLTTTAGTTNTALKAVSEGSTTVDLQNNEVVTAVAYSSTGVVLSHRQLLVENTAYISSTQIGKKYVVGITLESPFLSSVDATLIQYPFNLPMSGLELIGVVHYSNGDTVKLPVDGGKFAVYGFDEYVATQSGQGINLVLRYQLDSGEASLVAGGADGMTITAPYRAVTMGADGTYGLKLYPYPVWVNFVSGYSLRWFMYNLARNVWYDVTNHVIINATYVPYNPIGYGQVQRLSVSVNIRNVNGLYRSFVHTQTVDVVLARQGTERLTPWLVGFTPDQNPRYGTTTQATAKFLNTNHYEVRVNCGATTRADWLDKLYYSTKPLYSPNTETGPLEPTHFTLNINGAMTLYTIDQWNAALSLTGSFVNSMNIYVHWSRRIGPTVLELGVSGMPLWFVDSNGAIII